MCSPEKAASSDAAGRTSVWNNLALLGLQLPEVVRPSKLFVPALADRGVVVTSGQVPVVNGELVAVGAVGAEVDIKTAEECARCCLLNALAAIHETVGDLDSVDGFTSMTVYVASAPDFSEQAVVANAASELLLGLFGPRGRHTRSAVGVVALPRRSPVEVELAALWRS